LEPKPSRLGLAQFVNIVIHIRNKYDEVISIDEDDDDDGGVEDEDDKMFYSKPKQQKSDEDDKGLYSVSGVCSKNVLLFGVSSRTRSKNVTLFGCLSLVGASKRRKSDEGEKGLYCVSCSKKRKVNEEPFVVLVNAEVISIDEGEDDGAEKKCGLEDSLLCLVAVHK
jgi:hypothetical protein